MIVHNPQMQEWLRDAYSRADLDRLRRFLQDAGTFAFTPLKTGLFPAADLSPAAAAQTGYGNVWVRDNIHVAHALTRIGREDLGDRATLALAQFYSAHMRKIAPIVESGRGEDHAMNRPHIRFDGAHLAEDAKYWPHAQNDALGYFVWHYVRRALGGAFACDFALMETFALYFEAIRYWEDADSGHWEEREKVEASSIGAVAAALTALTEARAREPSAPWTRGFTDARLERLRERGRAALDAILPWECRGPERKARRYDSALLFLVYPLDVVSDDMARRICLDVAENLQGDYGIKRYLGDSYWTADYKQKLGANDWAADFSLRVEDRDRLARPGEEAQWCLFDPILSAIAGERFLKTGNEADRREQVFRFQRALGQLTGPECPNGALRCPEAYYRERGVYVANDHTPLLWTQANLLTAFAAMRATASA